MQLLPHVTTGKDFPQAYKAAILAALTEYPELTNLHIHFKTTQKHPVPYGTTPRVSGFLLPARRRTYDITILEKSSGPEEKALFRNLPADVQRAVIAHELVHVAQFNALTIPGMLRFAVLYPLESFKIKIERDADLGAIEHGFGEDLLAMARFLRAIPGYTRQRPEIVTHYLSPEEIETRISALAARVDAPLSKTGGTA
jgi:hypothetical protein